MKNSILSLAFLSSVLAATPALAWSEESHMTTGAIAFDDLIANDPDVIAKLEKILAAHPHFAQLSARAAGLTGPARTRKMFEWLARWPDDINGTDFEQRDWHYELRVVYGRTSLWPFRNGNASRGFDLNFKALANERAPDKYRAVAIGWLIHITGDIQQPLHAGHQMTSDFWATDEAGTLAYVRKAQGAGATDLHNYWDQILDVPNADGKVEGDTTSRFWAASLQAQWPRAKLTHLNYSGTAQEQFSNWLDGSMHLAQRVAYKGTYLKATVDPKSAPVVSPLELAIARDIAKRRVAKAGYRIADVLRMAMR